MRGKAYFLVFFLFLFMIPSVRAESGKELVDNSVGFDDKTVTFRGEVVGILMRDDSA